MRGPDTARQGLGVGELGAKDGVAGAGDGKADQGMKGELPGCRRREQYYHC